LPACCAYASARQAGDPDGYRERQSPNVSTIVPISSSAKLISQKYNVIARNEAIPQIGPQQIVAQQKLAQLPKTS